jgi:energy-converting hydrogenase Eha subunit H
MNRIPQLDYRISAALSVVCVLLFVGAFITHDQFGVAICGLSAVVNAACSVFSYSTRDMFRQERRQFLIRQTVGE